MKMTAISVAAFGVFACLPPFWTLPTAYLTGAAAAGGIAAINTVGQLGGFYGPSIIGWVKEQTGSYDTGMLVMAGLSITSALLVMVLRYEKENVVDGGPPSLSKDATATVVG